MSVITTDTDVLVSLYASMFVRSGFGKASPVIQSGKRIAYGLLPLLVLQVLQSLISPLMVANILGSNQFAAGSLCPRYSVGKS